MRPPVPFTILLFFNHNDLSKRRHFTMKCSLDEGKGRGYSCMVPLDNSTVGLVYQKVDIAEILGKTGL